jgi:glucose-6-phosphate 1-epimerase
MNPPLTEFHGQPAVRLQTADGASTVVMLHGGHVVSWITADGRERLYLSPGARFDGKQAIRGGVPVIFPQFDRVGPDRTVPRHGFARTSAWTLVATDAQTDHATATLRLTDKSSTPPWWTHAFELDLTVTLRSREIVFAMQVVNTGAAAFAFTAALHTYLKVDDIADVHVDGLQGCRYRDAVTGNEERQHARLVSIDAECDRIYFDVATPLAMTDGSSTLAIDMEGSRDVVIWNPWVEKCAALADMPPDGYREMLCIEAADIGVPPSLGPGQRWSARQSLQVA